MVFLEGETIHLRVVGDNSVHLTGYYIDDAEERNDYAGYDSEELDAEMNGEDIEESDGCCEHSEDEEEEDEETEDEMGDFIDDDSVDEDADEDTDEDTDEDADKDADKDAVHSTRKVRRIREITSDEDSEMDKDYETGDETEEGTEEDIEDDGCNFSGSADEEIDSDEAGSVDMIGKARKLMSSGAPVKKSKVEKSSPSVQVEKKKAVVPPPKPMKTTRPGGLVIEDIKVGTGIKAQKSRKVDISYTVSGEDGKPVESAGKTLSFSLGDPKVLKALGNGITGMALGGVRKLVVPGSMAQEGLQPALAKSGNYTITVTLNKVQPSFKAK